MLGPNVVSTLAFGKFNSPNYLRPDVTFTPVASRTGTPVVQGTNEIHFNVALPAGPKPASGYLVAIFGHGFGNHKLGGFLFVAASMAQQGIATVGINVVGHGFGPASTLFVTTEDPERGQARLAAGIWSHGIGADASRIGQMLGIHRGGSGPGIRQLAQIPRFPANSASAMQGIDRFGVRNFYDLDHRQGTAIRAQLG